jgi:hypothetical protein
VVPDVARRSLRLLVLVLLVFVVGVLAAFAITLSEHRRALSGRFGCRDVPMAPAVTPESTAFLWPYGAVYECRALGWPAPLFGDADLSVTLLLSTDAGPVLVRLDYTNLDAGRQYGAAATEIAPGGADLPADEIERINRGIQARGGLQPTPWIVHYGDG